MIKILYAGSPDASAETLKILFNNAAANGFEIACVLTNPPTAKGRHKELIPTPVAQMAASLSSDIPVFTPEHLDAACREEISKLGCDMLVCFAYGHIFGPKFLSLFKFGGINLHPSLLPKYRGCTPVNAAILNRDTETAFTIQTLSLAMDEGDILAQKKVSLSGTETAGTLLNDAAVSGADLIAGILKTVSETGSLSSGTPQSGEASYTEIIRKEDGKIDWSKSALEIDAKIRAYNPDPIAFCEAGTEDKPESLRLLEARAFDIEKAAGANSTITKEQIEGAGPGTVLVFDKPSGIWIKCGEGILSVTKLQKQGKNVMGYKDFMNGSRDFIGKVLK